MAKLVVIIQCDIVQKKCVGYACMKSFYERSGRFTGYDADTKYMTITCGGCCGAGVAGKIIVLDPGHGTVNLNAGVMIAGMLWYI